MNLFYPLSRLLQQRVAVRLIMLTAAMLITSLIVQAQISFNNFTDTGAPPFRIGPYFMTQVTDNTNDFGTLTGVVPVRDGKKLEFGKEYNFITEEYYYGNTLTVIGVGPGFPWREGYLGKAYGNLRTGTSVLTLPSGTKAFYLYAKPLVGTYDITVTAYSYIYVPVGGGGTRLERREAKFTKTVSYLEPKYFGFQVDSPIYEIEKVDVEISGGTLYIGDFGYSTCGLNFSAFTASNQLTCATPNSSTLTYNVPAGSNYTNFLFVGPDIPLVPTTNNKVTASKPGEYFVYPYNLATANETENCPLSLTLTENKTPPNVTLGNDGPLSCSKAVVSIAATGGSAGDTYAFTGPNNFSQTGSSPTASVTAVGTYSLVVTGTNGCSGTVVQTTVERDPTPLTPTITGLDAAYCQNAQAIPLAGNPTGGTFTIDNQPATEFTPVSLSVGSHTVRYSLTQNGCTGSTSQLVEIKAVPDASYSGLAGSYCADAAPVTLTPITPGGTFTGLGVSDNTFTPAKAGNGGIITYSVMVNGCTSSSQQNVTVNPVPPTPTLPGLDAAYCKNAQAVTLAGDPQGGSFTIDNQPTTEFAPASLTVGSHTVRYSLTQNGCTSSTSQTVEIKALPNASFSGLASPYCADAAPVSLSPTTPGGLFTGPGLSGNTFTPAKAANGGTITYSVTVNGCTNTSQQNVVVTPLPTPTITGLDAAYCQNAQAIPLAGNPTGGTFTIDNQPATEFTPVSLSVGSHTVRYSLTQNGCTGSTSQLVEIKAIPTVNLYNNGPLTCAKPSVTLTPSPTTGLTFVFSGGDTPPNESNIARVSTGGIYSVTATNDNGCSASASTTVTSNTTAPDPSPTNTGPLSFTNTNATLTVTASPGNVYSYSFSQGATQQGSSNMAQVTTAGVYSVTVTRQDNGCTAVASTTVAGGSSPNVCRGGTAVINVIVEGDPVKYEWYKNSLTSPKLMETPQLFRGTATSSLTLINAQTNTQGNFFLKVTDRSGSVRVYGPYRLTVDGNCRAREVAPLEIPLRIELAPNPIQQERLRAVVRGSEGRPLQVELVDLSGKPVRQQHWPQADSEHRIDWDMSSQASGLYLLQVVSEAGNGVPAQRQSIKVVKP
ncbi:hypothetical protein [Spirosoma knui]